MTPIITVSYSAPDHFVVTDPDTGIQHVYSCIIFHNPRFIVDISIKNFFLEEFPGKVECTCSADAIERMQSIADFNCLCDEVRF